MPRAKLALLHGILGLVAASFALADEPQELASHPPRGSSQSPEALPPAAPAHNDHKTASEEAHVPPDPPQHPMGDMPYLKMAAMMRRSPCRQSRPFVRKNTVSSSQTTIRLSSRIWR